MGYLMAFLIGAGVGLLAAAIAGRTLFAKPLGGLGDLLIPLYVLIVAGTGALGGGLIGVLVCAIRRGEALLGLVICAGIIISLFAAFSLRRRAQFRRRRRLAAVGEPQEVAGSRP